jgi:hypothetical protein
LNTIRPYQLFSIVEPLDRVVTVPIPSHRGAGGLTLLETFVLLAAAKIVKAERVFEFGTFLGATTTNLALNVAGEVFTIDLGQELHRDDDEGARNDSELVKIALAAEKRDFEGVVSNVQALTGDSAIYDFSRHKASFDLVFIDGGHDLTTVSADTKNAFDLVARDKSVCILWHDYSSPLYPALTTFLEGLACERKLFHVGDTMIVAWFNDELICSRLESR